MSKIKEFATSMTSLIFLVISISGIMLFLHWNVKAVKELHEILGLVFVGVALLHVIGHWKSMKKYFGKKVFLISLVVVSVVSAAFIYEGLNESKGGKPDKVMISAMLNAPLSKTIDILGKNYNESEKILKEKGFMIKETSSLMELSKKYKKSPFEIVNIILNK